MASAINGRIRIPWTDLPRFTFAWAVPNGAQVEIDLSGIDQLPDKWSTRGSGVRFARDRFDFLNHEDKDALRAIVETAGQIDVVGDRPERIAAMVRHLRSLVEEADGARDCA